MAGQRTEVRLLLVEFLGCIFRVKAGPGKVCQSMCIDVFDFSHAHWFEDDGLGGCPGEIEIWDWLGPLSSSGNNHWLSGLPSHSKLDAGAHVEERDNADILAKAESTVA
ncbi:hypothetical protein BGZ60DRAFT_432598 [Tricladium varicosporioides]|nr:hypothetical protein BGZ60DRAFT_432598 [Hymenoscyphus varicosporioides]